MESEGAADEAVLTEVLYIFKNPNVHPGSRTPDLGSRTQKQQHKKEWKKFGVLPFL